MFQKSFDSNRMKIAGVILAAGIGKRIGCIKQLLPYNGEPILKKVVFNVEKSKLDFVLLVAGYAFSKIIKKIKLSRIEVVENFRFIAGQSSSIKLSFSIISDYFDACMFILGDQPLVDTFIIDELIRIYSVYQKGIIVPTFRGVVGNPVIFSKRFFPILKSISGDVGGRLIFDQYRDDIIKVPFKASNVCFDIDTVEDYRMLFERNKFSY